MNKRPHPIRNGLWLVAVLGAILLILIGIWRGELAIIFRKAANICLECIGLG